MIHRITISSLVLLAISLFFSALSITAPVEAAVPQATCTWVGDTGNWSEATNWDCGVVPGENDSVILAGGTINVDVDATVQNLSFSASSLEGESSITVTDMMTWTFGHLLSTINIEAAANLQIRGPGTGTANFRGGTINNYGTTTLIGGSFLWSNKATFNNMPGALFDSQEQTLVQGNGIFNNAGTFRKSGSTETMRIVLPFNNTGSVEVQAGTLRLERGGQSSGTFDVSANAVMEFALEEYMLEDGTTWQGAGTYRLDGGSLINNIDLLIPPDTFFEMEGSLQGSGTLTVTNVMTWTRGGLENTLNIEPAANLHITGPGTGVPNFVGGTINNYGTTTLMGSSFLWSNKATFNNMPGALFDSQEQTLVQGNGIFNNAGTFRKSGSTETMRIVLPFNNTGSVEVQAGTLRLERGGQSSGTFDVSANAVMEFALEEYMLEDGTTWQGAGTYRLDSGTLSNNTDLLIPPDGFFEMEGALQGSGTLTVTNVMTWTRAATLRDTILAVAPNAELRLHDISRTGASRFQRATINNYGTMTLADTDGLLVGPEALFNNMAGGVFDIVDNSYIRAVGGGSYINNAGTFRKTGSSDANGTLPPERSTLLDFNNTGSVEALSGTLYFEDTFIQTDGATYVNGGTIDSDEPLAIEGGIIGGNGTIEAAVNNSAGQASSGFSAGALTLEGDYTQDAAAQIVIEIGGTTPQEFDQLTLTGESILNGTLTVTLIDNFIPSGGDSFQIVTYNMPTNNLDINLPTLPSNLGWETEITASNITLSVEERYLLYLPTMLR